MPVLTDKKQFVQYILFVLVLIVLLNAVARSLFWRVDITDRGMYSLSQSSRAVVGSLDDRLVVKAFYSDDVPGAYAGQRRYLQDMLQEYEAYSNGHFHFEFVSPDKDEDLQKEARNYQIPPVQMQAVENDKIEVRNVYMGLAFLYQGKKETIPVVQSTQGLEYNITATIRKISAQQLKSVGIISEESEEVTTQGLRQFLEQVYSVRTLTLSGPVPEDIAVLIMNGRSDSLSLNELYHLDQFLLRGGRIFLAQGRVKDMWQQGFAMDIRSNMFGFLKHHGIDIHPDLITDKKCTPIQIQTQQGPFLVRNAVEYPLFPMIERFNDTHPITNRLTLARVFFVNEVGPVSGSAKRFEPLLLTSDKTGSIQGPFYQISPMQNPMMHVFPFPSKVVAALVEGAGSSYFEDSVGYSNRPGFIRASEDVRMIVVTDNQFFNDKRAGGIEENAAFILNAIDFLSGDQELISIRAKDVTVRPLTDVPDGLRQTLKWLNTVLPPLLIVGYGLMRWRNNRIKRKILEQVYG